ncbi:MAG: hypothetical protein EZS28_024157 [Streblomastix strix]|uniref:Uncharacterized protein n=1 Tax=Streblomastix strix TaxID=222440 RepID=A0A5J4VCW0_9EUKA|nr:MAG: hypothetical protein EZS28_024157 [Streblomastix strix]
MSDSTKQNEVQSQKDPPRIDVPKIIPETHGTNKDIQQCSSQTPFFSLHSNIKDILSDDADYYTQLEDEYMEMKGCEVFVDERDGEVSVRYRGQIKAIVKENGHFEPVTGQELQYSFWEFETPEDMKIWTACILADAAQIKSSRLSEVVQSQSQKVTFRSQVQPSSEAFIPPKMVPIKRKREESQSAESSTSNSLQAQFQQQRQLYSKSNSLADQKVAQDPVATFEGVLKKQASKIDMLNYNLEPVARQKLFDEISLSGANIIFPMPEVGPLLNEEGPDYARRALESSVAVTQGMAMLINDAARNDTKHLVGKMLKVFEASLVSVSDSQTERESRLEGVYQAPQTEDVLSQRTKERYKKKTAKQINIGKRRFGSTFGRYSSQSRVRKRQGKRNFQFKPRRGFNREFKSKPFQIQYRIRSD